MSQQHQFFEARAAEARAEASVATLANVRDRCLRAAAAWEGMAARAHRTEQQRARTEAEKAAAARAAAAE